MVKDGMGEADERKELHLTIEQHQIILMIQSIVFL